jgi:5-methylcytosine-specific restriction protein A
MASAALRPCLEPRCPVLTDKARCPAHARAKEQQRYNSDTRKWYSTSAWQTLRQLVLGEQPVCADCKKAPSTEVDHIAPHRGDYAKFWNRAGLQGMCRACHGRKTQRGE